MTGFQSKRMATDRWINNDIHRIGKVTSSPPVEAKIRKVKPYPTKERLHELFTINGDKLVRKKPHHKERADRIAGGEVRGFWYVLVDGRQCKLEKLIEIYNGK